MSPTIDDYHRVAASFLADVQPLGEDLLSVLLLGSLARGEVVPGKSDVLDAVVVLRRGALSQRESCERALETLISACERVAASGLPYDHPVHYYTEEELADQDALMVATHTSPRCAKVLQGVDVRARIDCRPAGVTAARNAFFELRHQCHSLAVFLRPRADLEQHRERLEKRLDHLRKLMPLMACAALGVFVEEDEAARELARAFPELDTGILGELAALRQSPPVGGETMRGLVRRTLAWIEAIHDLIVARR